MELATAKSRDFQQLQPYSELRVWRWYGQDAPAEQYAFCIRDDSGAYYEFYDDKSTLHKETYSCHKH